MSEAAPKGFLILTEADRADEGRELAERLRDAGHMAITFIDYVDEAVEVDYYTRRMVGAMQLFDIGCVIPVGEVRDDLAEFAEQVAGQEAAFPGSRPLTPWERQTEYGRAV